MMNNKFYYFFSGISILILASLAPSAVLAYPKPQKVTAISEPVEVWNFTLIYHLEFWNVGALDPSGKYSQALGKAECTSNCNEYSGDEFTGTFSGGPNGTFQVEDVTFSLIDGQSTTAFDAGMSVTFTVNNPEAFEGDWSGQDVTKEGYVKLPQDEEEVKADPKAYIDFSFPKINKILGEVEVYDPVKTLNRNQQIWNFITRKKDIRSFQPAKIGFQTANQTTLRTGTGKAVVEFNDGIKFVLDRNSSITFNSGGFTINNGSGSMTYSKIGTKIILKNKKTKFGILGTTVSWEESDSSSVFRVLEGSVQAENSDNGQLSVLSAGDEYLVTANGDENIHKFDIQPEVEKWNNIENQAVTHIEPGKTSLTVIVPVIIFVIILFTVLVIVKKKKHQSSKKSSS